MFAHAYALASQYTHPIVVSTRRYDGRVSCSTGAFIVLDDQG